MNERKTTHNALNIKGLIKLAKKIIMEPFTNHHVMNLLRIAKEQVWSYEVLDNKNK